MGDSDSFHESHGKEPKLDSEANEKSLTYFKKQTRKTTIGNPTFPALPGLSDSSESTGFFLLEVLLLEHYHTLNQNF